MRPIFFLCAETVIIDQRTNGSSVINILEQIQAAGFPLYMNRLSGLALFEKEEGDPEIVGITFEVRMDQNILFSVQSNLNFQGKARARYAMDVMGFLVPGPGVVEIAIFKTEGMQRLISTNFSVSLITPNPGQIRVEQG